MLPLLSIWQQFDSVKSMKAGEILELEGKNRTFSHAYLLIGNNQSEIVKTINDFIKAKNCQKEDVSVLRPEIEKDGKRSEIKIDDVRALLHQVNLSPHGSCRIAIIYNAEKLNQSSGNILLKILEEPPKNLTIVLVSATDDVLLTIKSRCRILKIGKIISQELTDELTAIFKKGFFEASQSFDQIIKENKTELLLKNTMECLRQKMLENKDKKLAGAIRKTIKTKKRISQNASPRLALESLYLSIKNHYIKEIKL